MRNIFFKKNMLFLSIFILLDYIYIYNNIIIYIYMTLILINIYCIFFEKKYNYVYVIFFKKNLFLLKIFFLIKFVYIYHFFKKNIFLVMLGNNNLFFIKNNINISFYIDNYSIHYILLTSLLTYIILIYSYNYMKHDVFINNFCILINCFSISMITLLLAGNFLTLVLGWELIGLTSFFLINFWGNRVSTLKAALKAFFFNKISDCGIFIFMVYIIYNNNNNFVFSNIFFFYENLTSGLKYPYLFLIMSAFCKSAQFGFHVWLPDSMEAPIPASALIHSATLVSAGIYICGRFMYQVQIMFLELSFITTFTAFYGAIIASCQTDVKKILAYSTISHCGYLFFLIFFGNTKVLLIYLYIHGFFKAFSFMFLGFFLQTSTIYQDYRYIGNSSGKVNFIYFALPSVLLNLSGLPFFLGFFSKFFVIVSYQYYWVYHINMLLVNIGAFCGLIYSLQLLYGLFFDKINKSRLSLKKVFFLKNYENHIYILYTILMLFIYVYVCWFIFFTKTTLEELKNITWFNLVFIKIFYKNFVILLPIFFPKLKKQFITIYIITIAYLFFPI